MEIIEIDEAINTELIRAREKFPDWHKDIIHAGAVLQEESGELLKACINFYFGRGTIEQVKKEMAHTGAMVYRFGLHLESYKPKER